MLEDLIIEIESIDTTNLSEQEKVVIDCIEETQMINFNLTRNSIFFYNNDSGLRNYWHLKRKYFSYNYLEIYRILKKRYSYNNQEIDDLVKDIFLKHYKINVVTAICDLF